MTSILQPYTILALQRGQPPQRVSLIARNQAHAIHCARELFPNHIISAAMLLTDWEDDPA